MENPLLIRGIERILIVIVAGVFAYLGFRLFVLGHSSGPGKLSAKTKLGEIILSGAGPGLFFMAFGGLVLLASVFHGDYKYSETTSTTTKIASPTAGSAASETALATAIDAAASAVAPSLRSAAAEEIDRSAKNETTTKREYKAEAKK